MPLNSAFRVLVVDDDELDRMAVRRALVAVAPKVVLIEETSAIGGFEAFTNGRFDCVLLDFHLLDGNGLELLTRIRECGDTTPVIMLTGVADAQTAAELMKSGATDYIAKSLLSAERLERSLRYALRIRAAEEQVRRYTDQLKALSHAALRINATLSTETMLAATAEETRSIIGAQSAVARLNDTALGQTLEVISRDDTAAPDPLTPASELHAPLLGRDAIVLGHLAVIGKLDGSFSDSDRAIVTQLAQLASVAIENARLFETARAATRARDDVLAIVSHDLRNPVHTIVMAASVLLESSKPDDRRKIARQQSEVVLRAANRANRLIDDLLDATRIESGTFAIARHAVSIDELVKDAIELLTPGALASSVQLATDIEPGLPLAYADAERILQVFSNLGGNAIKFTPAGGRVIIAAALRHDELRISVVDSGVGIPSDDVPHVFDRYWQGRDRARLGAGLGLWIVKGIIEAHGGRIEIESTQGIGTRVRFTLPLAVGALVDTTRAN
jgi:signal transduction histidine kinase